MTAPDDDFPAGWLTQLRRGFLSGFALLALAIGLCAVPAFACWFVPGSDTTPALSALKAAALLALSGAHGGLDLDGTATTLTPLLVSVGLGWLVAAQARRVESWYIFAGSVVGYGTASAAVASWARLGSTHAPVVRSFLAALVFTAVVGGLARAAEVCWEQVSPRLQQVIRAATAVCVGYLALGSVLCAVVLALHLHDASALQHRVAPGAAGLPVALLGVAATPNAVIAAVGYLVGPGFSVGTHTAVSVLSVSHGAVPIFPLLAGLPQGQPATVLGLLLIVAAALAGGWVLVHFLRSSLPWPGRLLDCAAAIVLAAGVLMVLSAAASGGLGGGSLRHVGPTWWAVGGLTIFVLLLGTAAVLAVEAGVRHTRSETPAQPVSLYAVATSPEDHPISLRKEKVSLTKKPAAERRRDAS